MSNYENNYIILRTYRLVWRFGRKFYSIEGIKLPFPVDPNEAIYFVVSIAVSILLIKFVPFYNKLHFVIKFVAVPVGLMKFLTKQKLDGKYPHKFLADIIRYAINPKSYSRFKSVVNYKTIRFTTPIVYRNTEIVNKTKLALAKDKKRRKMLDV